MAGVFQARLQTSNACEETSDLHDTPCLNLPVPEHYSNAENSQVLLLFWSELDKLVDILERCLSAECWASRSKSVTSNGFRRRLFAIPRLCQKCFPTSNHIGYVSPRIDGRWHWRKRDGGFPIGSGMTA